eukprot:COSAG01_NODE_25922_length_729_cov_0.871429_1_plen_235_part_10
MARPAARRRCSSAKRLASVAAALQPYGAVVLYATQDEAHDNALCSGHAFYIAIEFKKHDCQPFDADSREPDSAAWKPHTVCAYASFKDIEDYRGFMENVPRGDLRTFYEQAVGRVKFFMDIEYFIDGDVQDRSLFEKIVACFVQFRAEIVQEPITNDQIRILNGSRLKDGRLKMSFHVVINDGKLYDGAGGDMHLIGMAFKACALAHIPELAGHFGADKIIDPVWTSTRNFRAPF